MPLSEPEYAYKRYAYKKPCSLIVAGIKSCKLFLPTTISDNKVCKNVHFKNMNP